jgi:uncharacterized protein with PIN domain
MPFGSNPERVVVLDTSVLLAVFLGENSVTDFAATLNSAKELLVGAPTSAEAGMCSKTDKVRRARRRCFRCSSVGRSG